MVVAMIGILAAIALPVMKDMTASIKLNEAVATGRARDAGRSAEGRLVESRDSRAD